MSKVKRFDINFPPAVAREDGLKSLIKIYFDAQDKEEDEQNLCHLFILTEQEALCLLTQLKYVLKL